MHPHTKFGIPTSKNIGDMPRTWGGTDSVITICLPKFLWGHKRVQIHLSNWLLTAVETTKSQAKLIIARGKDEQKDVIIRWEWTEVSLSVLDMAADKGHSSKYPTLYVGLQIYGGPGSLSHDFKIWPITFQGSGPSGPILFSCEKISL